MESLCDVITENYENQVSRGFREILSTIGSGTLVFFYTLVLLMMQANRSFSFKNIDNISVNC